VPKEPPKQAVGPGEDKITHTAMQHSNSHAESGQQQKIPQFKHNTNRQALTTEYQCSRRPLPQHRLIQALNRCLNVFKQHCTQGLPTLDQSRLQQSPS